MKKLVLLCVLGCSMFVFGQNDAVPKESDAKANVPLDARNAIGDMTLFGAGTWLPGRAIDNSIEGTPYLFSNWDGMYEIFANEKNGYRVVNLNYNVKTKTLESKIAKDSVFQFDSSKVDFIKHDNKKYKFYTVNFTNELFQVIYSSSKVVFLKGFYTELTKPRLNPMTQEMISKSKYLLKEKFVIRFGEGNFDEIDMKKKAILKGMGDKSTLVERFASDSKLSFNSEKDLYRIFQYYDTL